jgi:hypothetical protein
MLGVRPFVCWDCGFEFRWGLASVSLFCSFCGLSSRGLCDGPIPLPEDSYQMCVCLCVCFIECDQVQQYLSTPTVSRCREVRIRRKEMNKERKKEERKY